MEETRERRPALDVLTQVAALLDVLDPDRSSLADTERLELVAIVHRLTGRLETLRALLSAEAHETGAADRAARVPLTSWLATSQHLTRREAARIVGQGRDLTRCPQVAGQAVSGQVGFEQAAAITRVLTKLPAELAPEQLAQAETILLDCAAEADSHELAGKTREVFEAIDPVVADDREATRLDRELKVATANRHLDFWPDGHGSVLFKGSLPTVEAEPFLKIVDAYAGQQRRTDREQATQNHDHRGAEELTPSMRRADALVAMIAAHQLGNRAPSYGGDRPRIVVTLDYNQLLTAYQAHKPPGGATKPAPSVPDTTDTTVGSAGHGSSGRAGTEPGDAAQRDARRTDPRPDSTEQNNRARNGPEADRPERNGEQRNGPEADRREWNEEGRHGPEADWREWNDSVPNPAQPDAVEGDDVVRARPDAEPNDSRHELASSKIPERDRARPIGAGPDRPRADGAGRGVGDVQDHAAGWRLKGALLESATPISAGELRRLACDADILPVVLGGPSEVLDVGRSQRLVTPAIRAALALRDTECIFPGCHTPPTHCHAHHIEPWWAGGPTALANLALLCPHHHGLIEPLHGQPAEKRWRVIAGTDPGQRPKVVPPDSEPIHEQRPDRRGRPAQPEEDDHEQLDHDARPALRARPEQRMLLIG